VEEKEKEEGEGSIKVIIFSESVQSSIIHKVY
jgi:hypothetical protein